MYPMTEIVARRDYRLSTADRTGTVVVQIGKPTPFPDEPTGDWYCPWTVDGPDRSWQHYAGGVDALQALLLATSGLRAELQRLAGDSELTWLDGGLGLELELEEFTRFVEGHPAYRAVGARTDGEQDFRYEGV